MDAGRDFECSIAHLDGSAVVVIRGEVDAASSGRFTDVLAEAMARSRHLVLDMSDVTFLDSSGLRVVVAATKAVADDGSVTVRNPSQWVMRVFEVSGLDEQVDWDFATTSD